MEKCHKCGIVGKCYKIVVDEKEVALCKDCISKLLKQNPGSQ